MIVRFCQFNIVCGDEVVLMCDRESESGSKTERKHFYMLYSSCYKIVLLGIIWKN